MIKTTISIDSSDLDALVVATYGRPYCFQQDGCESCRTLQIQVPVPAPDDFENTSIPEVLNGSEQGVSFEAWLARDPTTFREEWEAWENKLFWERSFFPSLDQILNDLHRRGLLDSGSYVLVIEG